MILIRKQKGFTILELMIVLTLVALISAVATPSVGDFIRNNRLKAQMFELLNTINIARSEAIKRKAYITICRVADPTVANPVCGSSAANTWTTGWIIFEDEDGDGTYDTADDTIIARGNPALGIVTIITNSVSNANLQYNPDGSTKESGNTARFAICDDRGGDYGRQINVSPVGRAVMEQGTTATPINCTAPT